MSNLPKIADRIKELSYTTGTSDFLLNGNVTGFSSFASAFDSGDVVFYAATDGTDYEVGSGVFTDSSTDTISRFVLSSSNSNNLVSFSAGAKEVYSTYPATNAVLSTSGVVPKSSGVAFWLSDKVISHDVSFIWDSSNDRLGINKAVPSFSIDVGGDSASSVIQSSGIRTGVSGIFFPSGTSVPGYSGGRQVEHFERNVLGDANAEAVIELSGVVDQYIWLKKQSAGLIFAGPPSGCGGSCTDAMPSFRTLVFDDIPDLTTVSGALNEYITNVSGIVVDTPSGVHGYLARWSDDDTLGVSSVYESGGAVGIGTGSPAIGYKLDVRDGDILVGTKLVVGSGIYSASSPGAYFGLKHTQMDSADEYMIMSAGSHTYISAEDMKNVYIRGGGNAHDHQISVHVSGITLGKYRPAASSVVPEHDVDIVYDEGKCIRIADRGGSGVMLGDCAFSNGEEYAGMKHTHSATAHDYMILSSGTDTFISAASGAGVRIRAGANDTSSAIDVRYVADGGDGIVLNPQQADRNTRIQSVGSAYQFYLDASTNRVGIGTNTPGFDLDVVGSGRFTYSNGKCGLHIVDDGGGHSGIHIGDCALGANQAFAGMKHSDYNMTTDYMIVSDGTDTYISAKDTGSVYLRPGGNAGEGGITLSDVGAGSVGTVFNEAGADRDIRMEGASFTNMFRLDASVDRIGIGTALPSHTLSVSGAINADQIYNSGILLGEQFTEGTIATATTAGTKGQLRWDSNYLYVCIATNTWKRVLLSTW